MDLTNVPRSKIEQAVSLQVPAVSPFSETGYWYFEDFGRVSIWLWDEALRRSLSTRDTERDVEVLPESCFTLEENEGSYVYRCKEGYMFQCWRDGELISDSWWEESLNKGQLEVLKRGLGGTIDDPQERDMDYAVLWQRAKASLVPFHSLESFLLKLGVATFLLFFSYQLTTFSRLTVERWQLDDEIQGVSTKRRDAIKFREGAYEARSKGNLLVAANGRVHLTLFDVVLRALPSTSEELIVWEYQTGQLEFVVMDKKPDLESYVRKLEEVGFLRQVRVEPLTGSGQLRVSAQVSEL